MQVSSSIACGTVGMDFRIFLVFLRFFKWTSAKSFWCYPFSSFSGRLFWLVDAAICNAWVLVCLYTVGRRKRTYLPQQNHLRPDPHMKDIPRYPNTNRKLDCWLLLLKRPGCNGLQHAEGGAFFEHVKCHEWKYMCWCDEHWVVGACWHLSKR